MPTSTEVVKAKRDAEAWEGRMRQVRAAEAARVVQPGPVEQEAPALLAPDGQPIKPEPSDG